MQAPEVCSLWVLSASALPVRRLKLLLVLPVVFVPVSAASETLAQVVSAHSVPVVWAKMALKERAAWQLALKELVASELVLKEEEAAASATLASVVLETLVLEESASVAMMTTVLLVLVLVSLASVKSERAALKTMEQAVLLLSELEDGQRKLVHLEPRSHLFLRWLALLRVHRLLIARRQRLVLSPRKQVSLVVLRLILLLL